MSDTNEALTEVLGVLTRLLVACGTPNNHGRNDGYNFKESQEAGQEMLRKYHRYRWPKETRPTPDATEGVQE